MAIEDVLATISLGQLVRFIVGAIAVLSAIIEWNKKIPFHPLTSMFSWIGSALMKNTIEDFKSRLDTIEKQQKANNDAINELDRKVENKFREQQKEADEKEAKRLRDSIICFSDSCRVHTKHTKTHFENVMRDYDDYINYCQKHGLANHYIEGEYAYIESVYQECLRENKFL